MRRASRVLATVLATLVGLTVLTVGTASAQVEAASFYDPPSPLPAGENGDVIRHEESKFYLDPTKLVEPAASVQRIMYRSTDTHGDPVAVTGTVLTPDRPWPGDGPRPIVAYAPGTQGLGDQCAPSKKLALGQEYAGPFISGLLSAGYGVVVTDYQGLGTPGLHTYVVREAEAHAVLDSVRAAQRLDAAHLPDSGPVAIVGYSQGGGASAAAAELAPSYAPELDIVGAYAGAVPADLAAVGKHLDGTYAAGLLGFAVLGLNEAYPELHVYSLLNERGKKFAEQLAHECVGAAITRHAFTRTETLTKSGEPVTAYLDEEPFESRVAHQEIGNRAPEVPMLVVHSALDDIVPYEQGREMAVKWCEQGATVRFDTLLAPTHVGGAAAGYPRALTWLHGRFAGEPAPDNCGAF